MQDFPVFLTHCRAKLPGNTFTALNTVCAWWLVGVTWCTGNAVSEGAESFTASRRRAIWQD